MYISQSDINNYRKMTENTVFINDGTDHSKKIAEILEIFPVLLDKIESLQEDNTMLESMAYDQAETNQERADKILEMRKELKECLDKLHEVPHVVVQQKTNSLPWVKVTHKSGVVLVEGYVGHPLDTGIIGELGV